MKMTLIYATKPSLKPMAFLKSPEDVEGYLQQKLSQTEDRMNGLAERAAEKGGEVPTAALERWKSARWVEVELEIE